MNASILEKTADSSDLNETFVLTPTGLQINGRPSFDEWMAYGQTLWAMRSAIQWAVADWIRYGEGHYADRYAQAVDETRMSNQTLQNYVWVAGKFEPSRRRGNLSFSHHEAVAAVSDPEMQDELLTRAAVEKMNREDIREAAKPFKPVRPERIQPHRPVTPIEVESQEITIAGTIYTSRVGLGGMFFSIPDTALLDVLRTAPTGTPVSVSLRKCEPNAESEIEIAARTFGSGYLERRIS